MKKYNFKVGDILVDEVGQKGVITRLYDYVDEDGFRGFFFKWEDSEGEDEIESFSELKSFHRVGEYIFAEYDIDKAYGFVEDIDKHIARLQEEKKVALKGIDYINHDTGETKYKPRTINGDLIYKTLDILDSVDGEKQLKKLKLTQLEYETARLLLKEYWDNGEATTFWQAVANFFKKQGFIVEQTEDGVGWVIRSE